VAEAERLREAEARVQELHLAGIRRASERRRGAGRCRKSGDEVFVIPKDEKEEV